MDGENNGKPYFLMDDLGGKPPIFGNTQMEIGFKKTREKHLSLSHIYGSEFKDSKSPRIFEPTRLPQLLPRQAEAFGTRTALSLREFDWWKIGVWDGKNDGKWSIMVENGGKRWENDGKWWRML